MCQTMDGKSVVTRQEEELITVMMYIVNLYNIVKIVIIYVILLLIIVWNPVYWLSPLLGKT